MVPSGIAFRSNVPTGKVAAVAIAKRSDESSGAFFIHVRGRLDGCRSRRRRGGRSRQDVRNKSTAHIDAYVDIWVADLKNWPVTIDELIDEALRLRIWPNEGHQFRCHKCSVKSVGRHDLLSGYEVSGSDSGDSFARRERMAEGWRRKYVASWESGVPAACSDNRSVSSAWVHFS